MTTSVTTVPTPHSATPTVSPTPPSTLSPTPLPTIIIPITVYILEDENGVFSSARDEAELTAVYEKVNAIWQQAGIVIEVQAVQRLTLPESVLRNIANGNFDSFFAEIGRSFDIPNPSLTNGFYAQEIGGPNGIVPFGARIFFVMDTPSVHDERVSSHEIGHIFGLHHALNDRERLMFSGTNGTNLTPEEIAVARYNAQGLLNRLR